MIRFIADEQLPTPVLRAIRAAGLDIVRVQDVGLRTASDPDLLEWAAANGRVVVSLDKATMPDFAYERIRTDQPMPGVIIADDRMSAGAVAAELLIAVGAGGPDDLRDRVLFLPM